MDTLKEQLLKEKDRLIGLLNENPDFVALKHIEGLLSTYKHLPNTKKDSTKKDDEFPANEPLLTQIIFIMQKEKRFLHNNEICDLIKPYWSNVSEDDAKRRISAQLSKAKRENLGNIYNIKVGSSNQNVFWGSSKWMGSDGQPLSEYKQTYSANENQTTLSLT